MKYRNTEITDIDLVQRAFDNKWELIGKIKDHENSYSYKTAAGVIVTLIPEKWITLNVYDFIMEIVD